MKHTILIAAYTLILCHAHSQVGIGTTNPNANAILELSATNKAFLPLRMTIAQRNAIPAPVQGMTIYNISTDCLNFYRAGGWYDPCVTLTALNGKTAVNTLLGGDYTEETVRIQQTTDGGFIVLSTSQSLISGNVTGTNHGDRDCWIVKLDASGNISWNKLLGGSALDVAISIQQTADGGYIVAGYSNSNLSGDVTSNNHGIDDCWIMKLDASGNILWNKLFGGNSSDNAYSIQQTTDGGYIVAGSSMSSANGDVTAVNHGYSDGWIIKLSELPIII